MRKNPEWFWAHRRKASLHHFSFLMHGMRGKGWLPVVNFWFDNQIVVGVPGKGSYVFYDKHQLSPGAEKYRDIQESIDTNPDFVTNFRKRTDELFGVLFSTCEAIDDTKLPGLSQDTLRSLYNRFLKAVMAGPIISVQLWGIEACFDENYKVMRFLRKRLTELGQGKDFELYKSALAVNTGETVAFTEKKEFYQAATALASNTKVSSLFISEDTAAINNGLRKFPEEDAVFEKHIRKYEWVNTEYTGSGWSREKWIELFQKVLREPPSPKEKLDELLGDFKKANAEREKSILILDPPKDVRHAIDALAEFIAQRDWTKGYMAKALLSYHRLLDEIAKRMGLTRDDLFYYSYVELGRYLEAQEKVSDEEIENRKRYGCVVRIKNGVFELITGKENISDVIRKEKISEPFETIVNTKEFKGLPASRGHITGKARVLEDASGIANLEKGEVLVTYMTTIEFIPAFRKASAVVTDEGGMSCHAAIISREFKLPCIVGTKVATRVIQTGDTIEVDADKGIVRII